MCVSPRWLLAALLLFFAGAVAASAEDLPTPDSWITYLRSRNNRVPRCSVEWKVERRVPVQPGGGPILSVLLEHQLAVAHTEQERTKLEEQRDLLEGKTLRISMVVQLDYYTTDRFFLRQSLEDELGRVLKTEYFLNGDGIIYREEAANHTVHMAPLTKAKTLGLDEVLRALPEFVLGRELASITELQKKGRLSATFHLSGGHGGHGVMLILERATHRLTAFSVGNFEDIDANGNGFALPEHKIFFKPAREDFAYPIPKEVIIQYYNPIRQVLKEEIWEATRLQVQPDPAQMHSSQYEFKPGYKVIDESGEQKREYTSDELIGKKKG